MFVTRTHAWCGCRFRFVFDLENETGGENRVLQLKIIDLGGTQISIDSSHFYWQIGIGCARLFIILFT